MRKTFKCTLKPTLEQERALAFVARRCRELYNAAREEAAREEAAREEAAREEAAREERKEAWQKCGVSVTEAQQRVQLPGIKEVRPEYRAIHSPVLQDVLTRLDRAFQAFFRRIREW